MHVPKRGINFLKEHIGPIEPKDLEVFPEYVEFKNKKNQKEDDTNNSNFDDLTAEDKISTGYKEIKETIIEELIEKLLQVNPDKFEQIVLDLIKSLGYGPKTSNMTKHTGKSGDCGIDGIVYLDRLRLDKIYLQAKRNSLDNKIGRSDIQKFCGALQGQKAQKGIFLTTSSYQKGALEYAKGVSGTLILLNGTEIAELMIEAQVGVNSKGKIIIPDIDNDYFEDL